ncbi:MAG TPA: hypothetical protein VGE74_19635 [Gemmata sp.]
MSRFLFMTACVAVGLGAPGGRAEEPAPVVSLLIAEVTATRDGKDTYIDCKATLDNATGRDLTVRSMYFSAFDGLEVVVTDTEGKVLVQQAYDEHQSVFSFKGRDFPVKKGKTTKELRFPVRGLPEDARSVRVRLVGVLPESRYTRILSSETLAVEVKKGTGK